MLRLAFREITQYYDYNYMYKFTTKSLSYYERQKIKIWLRRSHYSSNLDNLGKLDNCKFIKICNQYVTKYIYGIDPTHQPTNLQDFLSKIGHFKLLRLLYLHNNNLSNLPESISKLKSLSILHIGYNQLTKLPFAIGNLKSLTYLYLFSNNITGLPSTIGNLKSLKNLHLENNQLTRIPNEIGRLLNLKRLILTNNQITELPEEISHLTKLKILHLVYNPISGKEQVKIRQYLPNCIIYF